MEFGRVEAELARGDWRPAEGVFTAAEIEYCRAAGRGAARRFAACFAAKEAALKALGAKPDDLAAFREVELVPCGRGAYALRWHERLKRRYERMGVRQTTISIVCADTHAGAAVILES
jgi:phosphopantetheine--protein transferase-like protein